MLIRDRIGLTLEIGALVAFLGIVAMVQVFPGAKPTTAIGVLTLVASVCLIGIGWAVFMVRTLRRGTHRHWPLPLRWSFLGLAAVLAGLGAYCWIALQTERWGGWTVAWLIGMPIAVGIWNGLTGSPSEPTSTPVSR